MAAMTTRRRDTRQLALFGLREPVTEAPPRCAVAPAAPDPAWEALGRQLHPRIRLGTSSWSFSGWTGLVYGGVYTATALARHGLAAYASHPLLRTVGIDRTFYAAIPREQFAAYARAVPNGFRFLVKAPEACTLARFPRHGRYGDAAGQRNPAFLDAAYATDAIVGPMLEGLGPKAGPLVFQFPPQPLGAIGTPAAFADRVHRFLDGLPHGPLYAIEIRNADLLTPDYAAALAASGACHCLTVHPTMPDVEQQAAVTRAEAGPALVVRWMLHPGLRYEAARARYAPFDKLVDEDRATRQAIAAICRRQTARGGDTFVIANNKAEGSAPLSLLRLAAAIVDAGGSGAG